MLIKKTYAVINEYKTKTFQHLVIKDVLIVLKNKEMNKSLLILISLVALTSALPIQEKQNGININFKT